MDQPALQEQKDCDPSSRDIFDCVGPRSFRTSVTSYGHALLEWQHVLLLTGVSDDELLKAGGDNLVI